jgi:hypothetical protein
MQKEAIITPAVFRTVRPFFLNNLKFSALCMAIFFLVAHASQVIKV